MGNDSPRRAFEIGHHVLVVHIKDSTGWQHATPMRHQVFVVSEIPAKLDKIVRIILSDSKQLGEAGHARVNRVANRMNYGCVRQH